MANELPAIAFAVAQCDLKAFEEDHWNCGCWVRRLDRSGVSSFFICFYSSFSFALKALGEAMRVITPAAV